MSRELFVVTYRSDPEKLPALVPEPLETIEAPLVKQQRQSNARPVIIIPIEKLEVYTANRRERQRSARGQETKVVC